MDRPPSPPGDPRRARRERLWLPASLRAGAAMLGCWLEDLSEQGARVVGEHGLGPGQQARLLLQLPGQPPQDRAAEVIYRAALPEHAQVAYGLRLAPAHLARPARLPTAAAAHLLVVHGESAGCRRLVEGLHQMGLRPLGVGSLAAAGRWLERTQGAFRALLVRDVDLVEAASVADAFAALAQRWPRCRRLVLTDPLYAPPLPAALPTPCHLLPAPWAPQALAAWLHGHPPPGPAGGDGRALG